MIRKTGREFQRRVATVGKGKAACMEGWHCHFWVFKKGKRVGGVGGRGLRNKA